MLSKGFLINDKIEYEVIDGRNLKIIHKNLKVDGKKLLLVLPEVDKNVYLSARNLKCAEVITAKSVNTYKVLNADSIVMTESALNSLNELLIK